MAPVPEAPKFSSPSPSVPRRPESQKLLRKGLSKDPQNLVLGQEKKMADDLAKRTVQVKFDAGQNLKKALTPKAKQKPSVAKEKPIEPAPRMTVLTLPARAPDAKGGKVLRDEYEKIYGDPTKLSAFFITQLEKNNIPKSFFNFQKITQEKDGHTYEFYAAPYRFRVGTDDDFFEPPMDAQSAELVGRVLGFTLPTAEMVEVAYLHGETHANFLPFFAQKQSSKAHKGYFDETKKWMDKNGITSQDAVWGNFKQIIQPTKALADRHRLMMVGGVYKNKERVEKIVHLGGHHDTYPDYAQAPQYVFGIPKKDGKRMPPPIHYRYSNKLDEKVAALQKQLNPEAGKHRGITRELPRI